MKTLSSIMACQIATAHPLLAYNGYEVLDSAFDDDMDSIEAAEDYRTFDDMAMEGGF